MTCRACGLATPRTFCHFCERTITLIRAARCVSCTGPLGPVPIRDEGLCADCRTRNHRLCGATRHLLVLAAEARLNGTQRGLGI